MTVYYVKPDSDNKFPDKDITPVLEQADGLRAVNIPTTSVQYFLRYWWMYAFKGDNSQEVTAPGNLPDLDIDYLQSLIDQQAQTIADLTTKLNTSVSTITALQKMTGQLTGQVAAANQTIDKLQSMAGMLAGQIAQLKTTENKQ